MSLKGRHSRTSHYTLEYYDFTLLKNQTKMFQNVSATRCTEFGGVPTIKSTYQKNQSSNWSKAAKFYKKPIPIFQNLFFFI